MGRLDSFLPPLTRIPCAPPPISLARSGFLSVLARAPGSLWRTRRALQWRMLGAGAASLECGRGHREPRGGRYSRWWMRGASRRRARRASRWQTLGEVDLVRERGTDGEIEHQHVVSSSSAALLLGGLRGGYAPRRLLRKPRQEAAASRRRWQARPGRRTRTMTTLPASKSAAPAPRVLRQVEGRHPHCPWTRPSRAGGTAATGSLSLCVVDGTHVGCKNSCHN